MSRVFFFLVLTAVFAVGLVTSVAGQRLEVSFDQAVKSQYVGLGLSFGENWVTQTSVNVDYDRFSGSFFANRDLDEKLTNELDAFLSLTQPVGRDVEFTFEYGQFHVRSTAEESWDEIRMIAVSCDFLTLPFEPSVSFTRFLDYGDYIHLSGSKDFSLFFGKIELPVSNTLGLGINRHAFREGDGVSHFEYCLSFPIKTGRFELEPGVLYCAPLASSMTRQYAFSFNLNFTFLR